MSKIKYYSGNVLRLLITISATYFAIELSKKLDKFLGLLGALLCAPLAILMPILFHLKVVAKTKKEKMIDIGIFTIGIACLIMSTHQ